MDKADIQKYQLIYIYDHLEDRMRWYVVFYRVTSREVEYDPEASGEHLDSLNYYCPYTGFLVLDNALNVPVDNTFEVYVASNYFVREDSLYLYRNKLFHPDYDEGVFRYMVVRFENE